MLHDWGIVGNMIGEKHGQNMLHDDKSEMLGENM